MNTRNTRLAQENPKMQVLSDAHLQELRESGLTEIPSNYVSLSAKEAKELTGYDVDGLAIYYHQKDGNRFWYKKHGNKQQKMFVRFKPNWKTAETAYREKFEDEAGELPKYLTPKGAGCRPYFSQFISDWELKLKRAKEEIDFTEGEKKADKACLEGFTTIGLSGVTCFMDKRIQEPTFDNAQGSQWDVEEVEEQVKPENSSFLPELEEIKWSNRSVGICYDSDILGKNAVQQALLRLFLELVKRGANPFPVFLPTELDGSKNGLDDFLVRHGKEAYGLLRNACKSEQNSDLKMISVKKDKDGSLFAKLNKDLEPSNHIKGIMAYSVLKEQWAYREGVGFYEWTGTHWSYKGKDAINAVLTEFQDAQGWVRRSTAINSFLRSEMETRLRIPELIWNDGNYLGFTNGYLNAQNNEFMPCDKTKYLTSVLPYEFNEKATCPTWLKFLDYALNGNQELIKFLQAWFKWVLMPKNKNDVFPIQNIVYLIGRKGTGKGTALNILMKLVGEDNTASATPKTFGNPEALGRLLDKKLGVDPDATQYLEDVGDLNKVVSNELVEIRKLYVGSSQKRLGCVLTMAMNEFIKVPNSGSEGLLRRIIPVPFMKRPKEVDPDLAHKLQQELAGIFQWAWQLSFTQVKHRIIFAGRSEAIAEQAKERFYHDNPEFEFLKEQFPYGAEILSSELYSLYAEWARSSGFKVMSLTSFGSKLSGYYSFEKIRKQPGNVYVIPNMTNFDLDEFLGLGGNKTNDQTVNYDEFIIITNQEITRLQWDEKQCKSYLKELFGKSSRSLLEPDECLALIKKLKAIPTPPNLIPIDEIPLAKDGYGKVLDISFGTVPNAPELLEKGEKTVTRRKWKEDYVKHFQKAQMRNQKIAVYNHKGEGGYQIGWVLIEKIYQEKLAEMPEEHLAKEGGMCHTKEHFINRYFDGDSSQTVTVIEFKYFPYTGEIKPIEKPYTPKSNNSKPVTPVEVIQTVPVVADSVQNQKKVYLIDDEETEKPELDQQFTVGNCVTSKIDYPDQVGLIVDNKLEGKLWVIKVEWADGKTDFYYPDQILPYQSSNE